MADKKEIILIRHGETEWNKVRKYQGHMDIELNDWGRQQAGEAAKELANLDIDYFASSDLKRARETAEIIASFHNNNIKEFKELREMNFGEWEGKGFKEIKNDYPEDFQKWIEDPIKFSPPAGETLKEFQDRVLEGFNTILENGFDRNAIVTHGGVIMVFLATILEMPLINYRKFEVANTGITRVNLYDNSYVLKEFNSQSHMK
ncbi:alpha-ribazole phosphatase [Halanaerobiaceae bacterium Z-7014]|uniref:Alpha-ribazole phosphatase n=1 Tax=Halonatronomonas betaini TaxID=2778430 RepID=A0A931AWN7_9FIRM|nr:alpha-ribazole phosphatase [Halonatronomonas betaini]MBF8437461.1 alpha-ribazole phosphatase [Halonatronomonas betaini]